MVMCEHVYKDMGTDICKLCGAQLHETDWKLQNQLHREWKIANPNAKSEGWWSI